GGGCRCAAKAGRRVSHGDRQAEKGSGTGTGRARMTGRAMADAADLLPIVYDELRKLAAARLAHERPGQTLTATALVHEAYVRLLASRERERPESPVAHAPGSPSFANRAYFFAAAAEAMRRILIERARQK